MPSIKNIIIFVSIAAVLVGVYVVFVRGEEPTSNLVSTPSEALPGIVGGSIDSTSGTDSALAQDFLNLLLSVKNIKLDDSLFSEVAWSNLKDSSIELVPPKDEGRPNPFAPLGVDALPPASPEVIIPASDPLANPPANPIVNPTTTPLVIPPTNPTATPIVIPSPKPTTTPIVIPTPKTPGGVKPPVLTP